MATSFAPRPNNLLKLIVVNTLARYSLRVVVCRLKKKNKTQHKNYIKEECTNFYS